MIFKKTLIALLLAGGAISFTACGKKDKPATTKDSTPVTPDPTPTPTPTPAPVVINYEDYPDVSKYTPYKLGLKDYYLLADCLDFDNVKASKYSSLKIEQIANQCAKFADSIVNMKTVGTSKGTLYNNNSVLYTEMNEKVVIEGNIPQELMVLMPEDYKVELNMKSLTANNNNYLFTENTYDIGYVPSSMMSTLPPETKTVSSLPSNFNMKTHKSFYPEEGLINTIDPTDENVKVYKIDDTHFVSIVRYIDVENPGSEKARIYNPETKTISETEIEFSTYNFYSQTCYFTVTSSGRYQLDYFFDEDGTKSFYLPYQDTNTIGLDEPTFINVGELKTLQSLSDRMLIDYSAQTDYNEKQTFINSFDIDLPANSLQVVEKAFYDINTFAPSGVYDGCDKEIVEQSFDSLTFDAYFTLVPGEADQFDVVFNYKKYNSKVISDEATTDALDTLVTGKLDIPVDLLVSKINNPNIVIKNQTVGSGDEAVEVPYLVISNTQELPAYTHYDIFVNITLKKGIDKDNKPCVELVLNSASAVLMPD